MRFFGSVFLHVCAKALCFKGFFFFFKFGQLVKFSCILVILGIRTVEFSALYVYPSYQQSRKHLRIRVFSVYIVFHSIFSL
jgi:hypothetical protein